MCKTHACHKIPKSYARVYILRAELNYIFILGLRLLISNTGEGARQESFAVFYSLIFLKTKYSSYEIFTSCIRQKGGHTFPNELSVVISFHAAWSPSVKRKYAEHLCCRSWCVEQQPLSALLLLSSGTLLPFVV